MEGQRWLNIPTKAAGIQECSELLKIKEIFNVFKSDASLKDITPHKKNLQYVKLCVKHNAHFQPKP